MENQNKSNGMVAFKVTITIVTVCCIIAGLWLNIFNRSILGVGSGATVSNTVTVRDAEKINVQADIAELYVEKGDEFKVEYEYPKNDVPDVNVENGTLTVNHNSKQKVSNPFKNHTYKLVITIPEGVEIKEAAFDVDAGELIFEDFDAENVSIHADAGSIEIKSCQWGETTLTADCGSIDVDKTSMGNVTVKADCGSIDFDTVSLETGDFKADLGSIDVNGGFHKIKAKCSMGSIEISTAQDLSEIELDLDADMGSVTVNGKDWK